jgi:hypothetical protein
MVQGMILEKLEMRSLRTLEEMVSRKKKEN